MSTQPTAAGHTSDLLTGLLDRRSFVDAMVREVEQAPGRPFATVFLDLQRFARINDALGPVAGDDLLRKFARRLEGFLEDDLLFGRITGDGFAVLVREADRLEEVIFQLVDLCDRPFLVGGNVINLASHLGAARTSEEVRTGYDLLHAAGIALHTSIDRGERVVIYHPAMKSNASRGYLIEQDLRASVLMEQRNLQTRASSDSFSLVYQPKVGAADDRLHGFEALLRWRMHDGTPVSPAEFIPVAERCGFMDTIGAWVLRAACAALAEWPRDLSVAVNVSPLQLQNGDWLLANITAALEEFGVHPRRLEIEITESALSTRHAPLLNEIAARGMRIWIDDFGSEYSTLARLCDLPFLGLKIDKSVTDRLTPEGSQTGMRLLSAISSITRSLGLESVIEGVENQFQADCAAQAGIRQIQGYHYSKPLSFDDAGAYIRRFTHTDELNHG